jgi:Tfp pilus assembly protein PilX
MKTQPRGSALIISIIVMLVITVIGVGMIRFAGRELAGSIAGSHERALSECAEAARLQLLAQFHALGFQPSQIQPLNAKLGTTGNATTTAVGGHYDTPGSGMVVEQVSYLPDSAAGPVTTARDLTGISSSVGQGGRPLKVVVLCNDGVTNGGRQLEVEFGIKFGL